MIKLEILQKPIFEAENPSVHDRKLILRIAQLHRCCLDDISALLDDVQFDKPVILCFRITDSVELALMQTVDVADVTQPRVQQTEVLGCHGGLDATTAVVAAYNDVLDLEVAHGVVDDGHDVQVNVVDEVGNVAVNEHLAGVDASESFGGDARVGAACVHND